MSENGDRRKEARVGVWMRNASRLPRARGGVRDLTLRGTYDNLERNLGRKKGT